MPEHLLEAVHKGGTYIPATGPPKKLWVYCCLPRPGPRRGTLIADGMNSNSVMHCSISSACASVGQTVQLGGGILAHISCVQGVCTHAPGQRFKYDRGTQSAKANQRMRAGAAGKKTGKHHQMRKKSKAICQTQLRNTTSISPPPAGQAVWSAGWPRDGLDGTGTTRHWGRPQLAT